MHLVAKHGIEPDVFQSGDFVLSLHREGQIPKLLKFWLIIHLTRANGYSCMGIRYAKLFEAAKPMFKL